MELIPAAMTILDVCAYLGLAAVGTATINMLLGLLIALRYSPVRLWPHRRINIFRLHNWTAYLVLGLILLHPAVLLLRRSTRFGWSDLVLPIHSPVQPTLNTVGAAALYGRPGGIRNGQPGWPCRGSQEFSTPCLHRWDIRFRIWPPAVMPWESLL